MRLFFVSLTIIAVFFGGFVHMAQAQEILIWDHDLGEINVFQDPEGAGIVGCEFGIERALTQNGYSFTTLTYLPQDISSYDVIFVIMGWFC
jgi:hypothetical protein